MAEGSTCPRKGPFIILATLALTACGPSSAAVAQQKFLSMSSICAEKYPAQPPTMGAYERCRNQAENATVKPYFPYLDVYELVHARRQDIANQADAGQITLEQANFEIAQATEAATKVIQRRTNQKALIMIPSLTILQVPSRAEMGMGMK
jgi:hypothetical protein